MAKELPYFKFEPNQWENGNIQMCSRDQKGLFIDLCSMYWSRLGDLPFKLAVQKLSDGNATALNSLCEDSIIALEEGYIRIDFLNEQLMEFESLSKTNSQNALEGWKKRRKIKDSSDGNATALNSQSESDAIREEKKKENKKKEDKIKKGGVPIELHFPFESEKFIAQWNIWKDYKLAEFKFKYKSVHSEQGALIELNNLSGQNEEIAIAIIQQSINKTWKGFFELKNTTNGKQNTNNSGGNYSDEFMRKIASGLQS